MTKQKGGSQPDIMHQANNLKFMQINYELQANHLSITLVISAAGKHCFAKCYSIPLVISQVAELISSIS